MNITKKEINKRIIVKKNKVTIGISSQNGYSVTINNLNFSKECGGFDVYVNKINYPDLEIIATVNTKKEFINSVIEYIENYNKNELKNT